MDIRLDGVRVVRGDRTILEVPELLVRSGRVTAILGPNGAGKTTVLRVIAGLDRPAAGSVWIAADPAGTGRASDRVAFAFQRAVFVAGSVRQNLLLGLRLRGVPAAEREARVEARAAEFGIGHVLERDVRRLSGGEAQRVNLARALALGAPVVLLDEPLAGLDAPSREGLLHELPSRLRAHGGQTVIVVTHDRDEAARLADDVVILIGGVVHSAGTVEDVFAHPRDAESARFLGWTILEVEGALAGIPPGALTPGPGELEFELAVNSVVPVGARWEAVGRIGGSPARVAGEGERPLVGRLVVSTRRDELVLFAG